MSQGRGAEIGMMCVIPDGLESIEGRLGSRSHPDTGEGPVG